MKQLQWFPGHIAKTIKQFNLMVKDIDYFFILLDARTPLSSYISEFSKIAKPYKSILIFTKVDLVSDDELNYWINYFKKNFGFEHVLKLNLKNQQTSLKKVNDLLDKIKYKSLIPKFAMLGIPNVGKSTLTNLLTNKKSTLIENRAGVTKHLNWFQFGKKYWIMDSPGILESKFENINTPIILSIIGSIKIDILPLDTIFEFIKENIDIFGSLNKNKIFQELNNSSSFSATLFNKLLKSIQNAEFGKLIFDKKN